MTKCPVYVKKKSVPNSQNWERRTTLKFFVDLPFAIFLLLGCAPRGCIKFLMGSFGVCVVGAAGAIPAVRGCARVAGEFEKKITDEKQLSENKIHCLVFSCCSI